MKRLLGLLYLSAKRMVEALGRERDEAFWVFMLREITHHIDIAQQVKKLITERKGNNKE